MKVDRYAKFDRYTRQELYELYKPFAARPYFERLEAVAGFAAVTRDFAFGLLEKLDAEYEEKTGIRPPKYRSRRGSPLIASKGDTSIVCQGTDEAAAVTGLNASTIWTHLKDGKPSKGWHFCWLNDEEGGL